MKNRIDRSNREVKSATKGLLLVIAILTAIITILLATQLTNYAYRNGKEIGIQSNIDEVFNIFSVQYRNKSGKVTVSGLEGKNVIAPGTSAEFRIRIKNVDKIALNYDVTPSVRFTSEHRIPILVRMIAPDGTYIAGDEETWVDIEALNECIGHNTLRKRRSAEYVFQWKWDFESGDDAYDTALGSAALTAEIGLQVDFSIRAEANTDIETTTGMMEINARSIALLCALLFTLILAFILTIAYMKKRKNEQKWPMPRK